VSPTPSRVYNLLQYMYSRAVSARPRSIVSSQQSRSRAVVALAAVHVLLAVLSRLEALPIAATALEQYHIGWVLAPEVAR